jgi:hypothetical protein
VAAMSALAWAACAGYVVAHIEQTVVDVLKARRDARARVARARKQVSGGAGEGQHRRRWPERGGRDRLGPERNVGDGQ